MVVMMCLLRLISKVVILLKGHSSKILEKGSLTKTRLNLELGSVETCENREKCLKGGEECECKKD